MRHSLKGDGWRCARKGGPGRGGDVEQIVGGQGARKVNPILILIIIGGGGRGIGGGCVAG